MAASLLVRLFHRAAAHSDGKAETLVAHATGIPPALLDAASLDTGAPDCDGRGDGRGDGQGDGRGDGGSAAGRRARAVDRPHTVLEGKLAEKVLHAWLQNRHQTLYPLTINLRTLDAGQAQNLARLMALALQAGTAEADPRPARAWLASVGAGSAALDALDAALAAPPALSTTLAAVALAGTAAYAYVVALVALDPHDPAATLFLDYLAARLALPTTVVRSANRRYRR